MFKNKENLPSWTKFRLSNYAVKYCTGVIMDDYLIVFALGRDSKYNWDGRITGGLPPTILAFNLLDHTIQEVEMDTPSFISPEDNFSFIKYGENQIIKYAETKSTVTVITVESFEPLKVKYEDISDAKERKFWKHTAQIHKDCLYIYGRIGVNMFNKVAQKEFWSFDLKNRSWKSCETAGEAPTEIYNKLHSFIFQDNFYVYGVVGEQSGALSQGEHVKHLFKLNLNSMEWVKIEQKERYLEPNDEQGNPRSSGVLYRDHLVTLKQSQGSSKNMLCFLNLHTKDSWSTFDIEGAAAFSFGLRLVIGELLIFRDSLLSLTADSNMGVAIMDLSSFEISTPKSAEEENLSSLFMSQEKSDIAFKVDGRIIPAHKEILLKKSKYFAGLFNSNMAESKQDVIEINDCEYETFREYLQYIYQDTVNLNNANQAISLYILADKYLREDLCQKCLRFLISILSMENISAILDFAYERNLAEINDLCKKFFKNNLAPQNVAGFISYLESREDEEFKERNNEFRKETFKFVLNRYFDNDVNKNEDFIIKNTGMDTLLDLANFLAGSHTLPEHESSFLGIKRMTKRGFQEKTVRIKEATFNFVEENAKTVMANKIAFNLPVGFFIDFTLYLTEKTQKSGIKDCFGGACDLNKI